MLQQSISEEKANISKLINETNQNHIPIIITGKKNNAVLLSLDDWNSIQETLYLSSMPNVKKSIIEGLNTSLDECVKDYQW